MFTCNFGVPEGYENNEADRKNGQILCREEVREKNLRLINVKKSEVITKKDMDEIKQSLKAMKGVNDLQMSFKE